MPPALIESVAGQPMIERTINGCRLTILGTAHVSQASADAVAALLTLRRFDAVAIELCSDRLRSLDNANADAEMDLFQVIRRGKVPLVAAGLLLGAYQQRLANKLGIEPGAEMRRAVSLAREAALPLLLIDRNIGITLRRVYAGEPWWKRWLLLSGLMASMFSRADVAEADIESLKRGDLLNQAFSEFAGASPAIYRALVDERDRFMAAKLAQYAQNTAAGEVLAVVGAGHLNGIATYLDQAMADHQGHIEALNSVLQGRRLWRWAPWVLTLLVLSGFAAGFTRSPQLGWQLVLEWWVINGGLAGIGALIAAAHPLTLVAAFVAAPLTSLNPLLGVGMVAGMVETLLRKPRVADFKALRHDVASFRGWYRNRVARTVLVYVLTSIGSAVGTYVAGFRIFQLLQS